LFARKQCNTVPSNTIQTIQYAYDTDSIIQCNPLHKNVNKKFQTRQDNTNTTQYIAIQQNAKQHITRQFKYTIHNYKPLQYNAVQYSTSQYIQVILFVIYNLQLYIYNIKCGVINKFV
jgi:hypothetical protein